MIYRWLSRLVLTLILIVNCFPLAAGAETATEATPITSEPSATSGSLDLIGQTTSATDFTATVRSVVDGSATIDITIYRKKSNRESLRASIAGGPLGTPLDTTKPITLSQSGLVEASVALATPRSTNTNLKAIDLATPGVYPAVVSLRSTNDLLLDSFITHIVVAPAEPVEAIRVVTVLELNAEPALQADGSRTLSDATLGDLEALVAAVTNQPNGPLHLGITPETLNALPSTTGLLATSNQIDILPRPYVDIDTTAWYDVGLDSEYIGILSTGLNAANGATGSVPDMTIWPAQESLNPRVLSYLGALGVEQVLFREDHLEPLPTDTFPLTLTQKFDIIDANGRRFPSAVIDTQISDRFPRGTDPELAAHQLLAELSVLYFEQPGVERGIIITPPHDWPISAPFLSELRNGLTTNPLLVATDLSDYFSDVSTAFHAGQALTLGPNLIRHMVATPPNNIEAFARSYADTQATIFSLRSLLGADHPFLPSLDERLLVSASSALSQEKAAQYITTIRNDITAITDHIVIGEPPRRITFASHSGRFPLTIENALDTPAAVLIGLSSDKLGFPDGSEQPFTLNPGTNKIELLVNARLSGDATLQIVVTSPDRTIHLGDYRSTVRTTALNGVGLIIAIVALVFLAVWWLRTHNSRRPNPDLIFVPDSTTESTG
jgi:hypothetical protein